MSDTSSHPLLNLIRNKALLDEMQLEEVLQENAKSGKSISQILAEKEFIDPITQLSVIADELNTEVVQVSAELISEEAVKLIPAEVAKQLGCVPVALYDSTIQVAFLNPFAADLVDQLGEKLGSDYGIQPVVADPVDIQKAIDKLYGSPSAGQNFDESHMSALLKEMGVDTEVGPLSALDALKNLPDLTDSADAAPIVKFVNAVLYQAVQDRASDIHFEPFEHEFKIRYRVDGALYEMAPPPKELSSPVISRLKIMANLNISERRLPQDGRIAVNMGGKQIDLRISTLPTLFGESVVLRVLDRSAVNLELASLGLPKYVLDYTVEAINQPNGIYVVTGPTGSGKTTTLYSCLREVNTMDVKILTAEDPVEFDIEGIMQVAVNEAYGMTFMRALRAFLRQFRPSRLRPSDRSGAISGDGGAAARPGHRAPRGHGPGAPPDGADFGPEGPDHQSAGRRHAALGHATVPDRGDRPDLRRAAVHDRPQREDHQLGLRGRGYGHRPGSTDPRGRGRRPISEGAGTGSRTSSRCSSPPRSSRLLGPVPAPTPTTPNIPATPTPRSRPASAAGSR